jgi:ABC-type dipeptide/oligopeptide/nickel transport system permease subunit
MENKPMITRSAAGASADSLLDVDQTYRDRAAYYGRFLWRDKSGVIGLIMFLTVVFAAVFAPWIAPYDPLEQNLRASKAPPVWQAEGSWDHILGTDNLGRDIFSRLIYGARVSLTVAFFGVLIAAGLGLIIGSISGYMGGRVDSITMNIINLILSLPYLLFVVFIAAILGRSLINVILIFGITDSPIFARVTRGEVLRMRQSGYVESAISAGARWPRIIFDHITPNLIGPLITLATFEMSAMIFYEAGLGFLGLSVPPSVPSWGNMLAAGRKYLQCCPWIAGAPGLAIMWTSLGMNLLGDWLRDVLDPRLRRSRK